MRRSLLFFIFVFRRPTEERGNVDGSSGCGAGVSDNKRRTQGLEQGGRGHVAGDATP